MTMKVTYSWRNPRHPHPLRDGLIRAARRATELAGLDAGGDWGLNVLWVTDRTMAKANRELVGHEGTTDVITFSYLDDPDSCFPGEVAVELLICVDVAAREGAVRADSDYASELMLYLVHGLLHASGEDDLASAPRRRMRRREQEVMEVLRREFDFGAIFPAN